MCDAIVGIVCAITVVLSFFCIYISIADIILLNERKKDSGTNKEHTTVPKYEYSVEDIISLLKKNDIIEMSILSNNQLIKLGASSDCHVSNSRFFNKKYYIDKNYNITIDNLHSILLSHAQNGTIFVVSIDDVSPKYYNIK